LAGAAIQPGDSVLDVGAGTGSLSIEAAFLAAPGAVYAIERDEAALTVLRANIARFERSNITVLPGSAGACLAAVPVGLAAALIGGSGGELAAIMAAIDQKLRPGGRIVMNIATLETLNLSFALFNGEYKARYSYELISAGIARLRTLGASHAFEALNPIYILTAKKKEE
jgi:precorrin-6Y C5,15-methyltransferase (decarboxylating) CbiT subunit